MFFVPLRVLRGQKGVKVFFVALRGSKGFKVFSVPLRVPSASSADKKVLRCTSCPFVALRGSKGFKVFSVPLRGPPRIKRC